jgi:hypothetical protein
MSSVAGRFDDFEVLITPDQGNGIYPVSVIQSTAGQASGVFALPLSPREIETALHRMRNLDTDETMLMEFGARLFSALFSGDVLSRYAESVGISRAKEHKGLRIRLHIQAPELAGLPWELMYNSEKREFLGLSKQALVTRYVHVPRPPAPLHTDHPLRILIAIASPEDLLTLDSEAEVARIKEALAVPLEQDLIQFTVLRNTTARALRKALLEPYHVLHFIGHGAFDDGVGSLMFEDEGGDAVPVSGGTLGTLLKNTPVQLVLLNACQSAQDSPNPQALAGVGPSLVEAGIPAVVAMQFVIGEDSARVLAEDFYEMLSRYVPVDECVAHARQGLMLETGVRNVDWATPVLYLRAPDGVIFLPEGVHLEKGDEHERQADFYELSTALVKLGASEAGVPEQKEIIDQLWALVDFPNYRRWATPNEAMSRWVAPYRDDNWDELERQDVTVVVEREPVTVILGDPGMGKTAILELLVFLYAERALRGDTQDLIPVFVKLSQYAGEDDLVRLIRMGLNRLGKINLSPDRNDAHTRALLAERRFLILTDGLNQLPGDEREQAHGFDVVKHFIKTHPQHKYVISCRRTAYRHELTPKAWVVLPHSNRDVKAYLTRGLGEARGSQLYQKLPERMRELARTPLVLSLLLDELRHRGDSAAKQLGRLFEHYAYRLLDSAKAINVEVKKSLLAGLAFAMKLDKVFEYDLGTVLDVVASDARKARLDAFAPQEILDDLLGSGLLRTGSTGRIAFSHPYYQDYFAGVALQSKYQRRDVDWDTLTKQYEWREAIHFLASTVDQPTELIGELSAHDPLLAAECLLETEGVDGEVKRQVVKAIADRETAVARSEKNRALKLLNELGSAGVLPVDAPYQVAADFGTVKDGERTTTVTLLLGRAHLVVPRGHLAGQHIVLFEGTACLGRGSKVDIELSDASVSRRHAEISITGEVICLRDLGSTNGTRVNGKQITSWYRVRDGDEIQLGDLVLVLQVAGG